MERAVDDKEEVGMGVDMQRKKAFIVQVVFLLALFGTVYFLLKVVLPVFSPFVVGLGVAVVLHPLVVWLEKRTGMKRAVCSLMALLIFYLTGFVLVVFFGNQLTGFLQEKALGLPEYYKRVMEPEIRLLTEKLVAAFPGGEQQVIGLLKSLENSLQQGVMSLSSSMIGMGASVIVGFPAILIQVIFMVISSCFLTIDFQVITGFVLRQFGESKRAMIVQVLTSARVVTVKILKVYAFLMSLTFVELYLGFSILRIPMAFVLAVLIAIVDILPVLGTGTVLIPWGILLCLMGQPYLGVGILLLYLLITVIRQILEPKIIGQQVGLHPIVTLLCIFAGAQLAGVLGIFLFPVAATVLKKLNDEGTICLFR